MDKILIGQVLKPQGISGQIKISDYTDGFDAVKNISEVFLGEDKYKVLAISSREGAIFLSLKGIADRNAAELLRGKDVYAYRDEIEKDKDNYFIVDIIGCKLYLSSGKEIGVILDVTTSNVDIFKVDTAEGIAYFPFLKKLNAVVDIVNKKITVDAARFTEVVLYE